jgi:zinc D-Ala-D-Ala carboxypeptidase
VVSLNLKTMEKLSKHVSYKEGVYSRTAERLGLKNDPSDAHLANMKLIAEKVFEPLREHVGGPIKINSFYSGPELNAAIGGSAKSQHCHGQAIDIDDTFGHATNAEMFYWIQQNLDFDQMIWEFGTDENPNWVHVSYVSPEENRKRCLKAYKDNGKTKYMVI